MSPTTSEGVVVKGVAVSTARLELVNTRCKTCEATVVRLESTAYSHVWHWLVNTPCGHSRLCQRLIWCPACVDEVLICKHCLLDACPHCGARYRPTISPRPTKQNASGGILESPDHAAAGRDATTGLRELNRLTDNPTPGARAGAPDPRPDDGTGREAGRPDETLVSQDDPKIHNNPNVGV